MSRTKHGNLAARMGRWSAAHWKTATFGWLAFVAVAFSLGGLVGTETIDTNKPGPGESGRMDRILDAGFEQPASESVLIESSSLRVTDPAFTAAIDDVVGRVSKLAEIRNVRSPLEPGHAGQISKDGHSALVELEVRGDADEATDRIDPVLAAVAAAQEAHPQLFIGEFGEASAVDALGTAYGDDLEKAGLLSLPITLAILVIAFGALVAAGIPLLLGLTAVFATFGLIALPSSLLPVADQAYAMVLLIGLAVGVDYSIFYLKRERQERAAGRSERAALEAAAATSGRSVLVSGLTVIVAMAGMFLTGDATFASLGVIPPVDDSGTAWMVAAAGLLGGLGWPVWLCVVPALAYRWIDRRRVLVLAAAYGAVLVFAALLIAAIEAPRGRPPPDAARGAAEERQAVRPMSDAPVMERLSRGLIQCIAAATAGVSTEDIRGRHLRDGSKAVVALLILLGGLGGSASGGVSLLLLAAAIRTPARPPVARLPPSALAAAGRSCVALLILASLATAFGLLVVEALTASAFQPPPTFADALLDAASAVGGAHVTSGVTGTVTDPNLTRGLGLGIDQYQYGMVWLMAAMLTGRVLPVWVIHRAVRQGRNEPPTG